MQTCLGVWEYGSLEVCNPLTPLYTLAHEQEGEECYMQEINRSSWWKAMDDDAKMAWLEKMEEDHKPMPNTVGEAACGKDKEKGLYHLPQIPFRKVNKRMHREGGEGGG